MITLRDGNDWIRAAHEGPIEWVLGERIPLDQGTASGRAIVGAKTCHFPDIDALDPVQFAAQQVLAKRYGFYAALSAPLLREGVAIGAIALPKREVGAFTPRQIELLETFAAQAVIAREHAPLTELRQRPRYSVARTDPTMRYYRRSTSD